jgi:hypothetical protein
MGAGANRSAERHDFLDGITKWSLRQCTSVKCIWKMRQFSRSKKYGKADLLFWWNDKGDADAVLTFRIGETPAGEGDWITGHCKLFPDTSAIPLADNQSQ